MPLDFFSADHAPYDRPQDTPILNRDSPQAQGLVGWWPGTGFYPHDSSLRHNAVAYAASVGLRIKSEQGIGFEFFNSTNDRIDTLIDTNLVSRDGPFTLAAWVNGDQAGAFTMGIGDRDTANNFHRIRASSNDLIVDTFNGTLGTATASGAFPLNTDILVAGVWRSAADRRIYVNGIEKASNTTSLALAADLDRITIGTTPDSTPFGATNGIIFHAVLYNKALNDSENFALWHPDARWDLSWQPRVMVPGFVVAAGPAVRRLITTPLNFGFMR